MSSSETGSPSSIFPSGHDEMPVDADATGVGLSNPHLLQRERALLDLINRMHNTG